MHVDLDAQVLVAYEGDRPVFATLVATGKKGYRTPTGFYRIRRKYVARRMQGPDPDHGRYDIGDVPWTMYYHGGLAIHGAYWHDAFGAVRSHGCTNVPPQAARWLFQWSDPEIPRGWKGIHEAGTWVYFTRA
jgi:lipoprotein-anchoring transpeptidase ErfK/SrfK